jgi:hypothetical protein
MIFRLHKKYYKFYNGCVEQNLILEETVYAEYSC